MNVSEIKKLAKELQDYTRVVGSHNNHIQSVANRLVELTEQPKLNPNQQIVLEWLKDYCVNSKWSFPFYVVMHAVHEMPASTFGFYDDFTEEEEFEVLAAFAQWGREQVEE